MISFWPETVPDQQETSEDQSLVDDELLLYQDHEKFHPAALLLTTLCRRSLPLLSPCYRQCHVTLRPQHRPLLSLILFPQNHIHQDEGNLLHLDR